jgi:hypothetical protein
MPNAQLTAYRTAADEAGWISEDRNTNRPVITSYRLTRPDSSLVVDVVPTSGALDLLGFRIRCLRRTARGTTVALDVIADRWDAAIEVLTDPAAILARAADAA